MTSTIFIGNEWRPSGNGATIDVIDPATEECIDHLSAGTAQDVDLAVDCARRAFEGEWSGASGAERANLLHAVAKGISDRREQLARLEVIDNGKPLAEALWDIDDAAGCFTFYADLAQEFDAAQDETIALPDERFESSVRREPVGVAAQIIPMELSIADGCLEGRAGDRRGLHHGAEAFRVNIADQSEIGRDRGRCRLACRRSQRCDGAWFCHERRLRILARADHDVIHLEDTRLIPNVKVQPQPIVVTIDALVFCARPHLNTASS
jgi:hypothetical protein